MKLKKKHVYVYINSVYEKMRYPVYIGVVPHRQNLITYYFISSFLESSIDREYQHLFSLKLGWGEFCNGAVELVRLVTCRNNTD